MSDTDTHICGICKTQFASIEDFLLHKRNGCFSFLAALPAALLSEYLNLVVVIPSLQSPEGVGLDTLSNQFNSQHQQMYDTGSELAVLQAPSLPVSLQQLLQSQQNTLPQSTADATSFVKYDMYNFDEIGNMSSQLGFDSLPSESGENMQLSQLVSEIPITESVTDSSLSANLISSVLSQTADSAAVSMCNTDNLLLAFSAPNTLMTCEEQLMPHSNIEALDSHSWSISSDNESNNISEETYTDVAPVSVVPASNLSTEVTSSTEAMPVSSPRRYPCSVVGCSFSSPYKTDLSRHTRIHTGEKPFSCSQCGKTFTRMDKLKRHFHCHTGTKPYKCTQCSYATSDVSSLKKHTRIHSNEKPFKCQWCSYAGRNADQLVVHVRTHTGDTPFSCVVCQAAFKRSSDLKRHARLHTGEKPYACDSCDYRCAVKGNLRSHRRINHSQDNRMTCEVCAFQTPSRPAYKSHVLTHLTVKNVYTCTMCVYTCNTSSELRVHQRTHVVGQVSGGLPCLTHSGDVSRVPLRTDRKQFVCERCDASFVSDNSLRSHIRCHQRSDVVM